MNDWRRRNAVFLHSEPYSSLLRYNRSYGTLDDIFLQVLDSFTVLNIYSFSSSSFKNLHLHVHKTVQKNKASLAVFFPLYKYTQPTCRLQMWTSCKDKNYSIFFSALFFSNWKKNIFFYYTVKFPCY